jgi:hypothetical protein
MMTLVDAARVHYPRSVISAHTAYYAVEFSRTRNVAHSIDLNAAFAALLPLSFMDAAPTERDWDFVSLNAAFAAEQTSRATPLSSTASFSPARRRVTPILVPSSGVARNSPGQSQSTTSPNPVTPPLPNSINGASPTIPPSRRVSFQDLGYRYRVGDKRPLEDSLNEVRDADHLLEDEQEDDYDDIGDSDSDGNSEEDDEEEDDDDGDDAGSVASTASHKRKSSKRNSNTDTLALIRALLEKMNRSSSSSATLTKPPEFWYNGEAPKGGWFLETFTRLYSLYKNFVKITCGPDEACSLTFKNLITDDMEHTVRSQLGLESDSKWSNISNSDLIKSLKSSLGFKDKDFYISQLEELQLPSALTAPAKIYNAFITQTSDMLRIQREAELTDVHLRKPTLKNLFQQYVARHYRINQWFQERTFKSLSKSIRHITKRYKKQHIHDKRKVHESRQDARANGARSDYRGGKVEPADADSSRNEARRKSERGRGGRGRGGTHNDNFRRGRGDSVTSEEFRGSGTRGRGGFHLQHKHQHLGSAVHSHSSVRRSITCTSALAFDMNVGQQRTSATTATAI